MNCCQCQDIETQLNYKSGIKDLKRYRKNGPDKTTRTLIDALKVEEIEGATLLDIGGGVGVIQHELLKVGVSRAINIEAAKAYIKAAKEEAERQGHSDQVIHHHGNFIDLATYIPQVDIVTLDRVICCYHDMQALVGLSSALTDKLYGVVYPRDTWRVKIEFAVSNFVYWIRRSTFSLFVHSTKAVDAVVLSHGLERCFYQKMGIWQVVVYARREMSSICVRTVLA